MKNENYGKSLFAGIFLQVGVARVWGFGFGKTLFGIDIVERNKKK